MQKSRRERERESERARERERERERESEREKILETSLFLLYFLWQFFLILNLIMQKKHFEQFIFNNFFHICLILTYLVFFIFALIAFLPSFTL